jgi:hypothetical protein
MPWGQQVQQFADAMSAMSSPDPQSLCECECEEVQCGLQAAISMLCMLHVLCVFAAAVELASGVAASYLCLST